MMIGSPKEVAEGEKRVAMTPDSALQLQKLGFDCVIESGAGADAGFTDAAYEKANVTVVKTAAALWKAADVVAKVRGVDAKEKKHLRAGQTVISFFWPAQNPDLMETFKAANTNAIAMDMVPRISRAQKMDALSSMANIAGYRAVIESGNQFGRFFTGQITAAGKVPPAKVLVIGAGVAGLAAIGTATSLGAIVRAFDVRPEVAEQIESMGAEFLMLEFDEDGGGEGGYAKPASPEFIEKEMALFREQAPQIDIVITTALIPGRPAPKLWPAEMVSLMKPGSVVVDLAAELLHPFGRTEAHIHLRVRERGEELTRRLEQHEPLRRGAGGPRPPAHERQPNRPPPRARSPPSHQTPSSAFYRAGVFRTRHAHAARECVCAACVCARV